jgi:hypothetical protein
MLDDLTKYLQGDAGFGWLAAALAAVAVAVWLRGWFKNRRGD